MRLRGSSLPLEQLRHKDPRPINQFFYRLADHPLDDRINEWLFPQAVPPRRPALGQGDGGGGKREREGHRSCWADSEVHSFILAKLTEGVSIDDYSTYRAVRLAEQDEDG